MQKKKVGAAGARRMQQMYRAGILMPEIGKTFGVSAAWVQILLARQGITAADGGVRVRRARREARIQEGRADRVRKRVLASLGADLDALLRAGCPVPVDQNGNWSFQGAPVCRKYLKSQRQAEFYQRVYPDYLTWYTVWVESGHFLAESGPEPGWALSRKDDRQPWSRDNAQVVRMGAWLQGKRWRATTGNG